MKRYFLVSYFTLVIAVTSFLAYHLMMADDMPRLYDDAKIVPQVDVSHTPEVLDQETIQILNDMKPIQIPIREISKRLPKVDATWQQNATVLQPKTNKPKLVIVIDDLGLKREATNRLAQITGPYTLAYLPYADDLPYQTGLVHDAGHELLVHMPMEPMNKQADPGRNAMLVDLNRTEFDRRLEWNLTRFKGFVGINNHMGSRFTASGPSMARVMTRLKKDGYLFLDSLTTKDSYGRALARELKVPFNARHIFLDNVRTYAAIEKQLTKAAKVAMKHGYAIAIGHPYDITLDFLEDLSLRKDRLPYELAPLSAVIKVQK